MVCWEGRKEKKKRDRRVDEEAKKSNEKVEIVVRGGKMGKHERNKRKSKNYN